MKQPDESPLGTRKTLLKRNARKPTKAAAQPKSPSRQKEKKEIILDRDVEKELVKTFGQK